VQIFARLGEMILRYFGKNLSPFSCLQLSYKIKMHDLNLFNLFLDSSMQIWLKNRSKGPKNIVKHKYLGIIM